MVNLQKIPSTGPRISSRQLNNQIDKRQSQAMHTSSGYRNSTQYSTGFKSCTLNTDTNFLGEIRKQTVVENTDTKEFIGNRYRKKEEQLNKIMESSQRVGDRLKGLESYRGHALRRFYEHRCKVEHE